MQSFILFAPEKNTASLAFHFQKPYTFPAFLTFFLKMLFSSPARHPVNGHQKKRAEDPREGMKTQKYMEDCKKDHSLKTLRKTL